MKKREFLNQGGVLASGVMAGPWLAGSARAQADVAAKTPHDGTQAPGTGLSAWQARLGEHFEARTPLGRSVTLHLAEVASPPQAHPGVEQFCLSFEGPRHLPLGEGLHALQGATDSHIAVHLQPVRSAEGLRYLAHFSLLA